MQREHLEARKQIRSRHQRILLGLHWRLQKQMKRTDAIESQLKDIQKEQERQASDVAKLKSDVHKLNSDAHKLQLAVKPQTSAGVQSFYHIQGSTPLCLAVLLLETAFAFQRNFFCSACMNVNKYGLLLLSMLDL